MFCQTFEIIFMHILHEYSALLLRVWAPTWVFSSLLGVCCYYQAVILVWILIMCEGEKIRQSFEGYLQTFEA